MQKCWLVAPAAQLSSLAVLALFVVQATIAAVEDWVRGYSTGHAREKPHLRICAWEIGDLVILN